MTLDKEDNWAIWLAVYSVIYSAYILLESRDDQVDLPIALMATGLWIYAMLKTLYEEYKRSI